MMKLRSCSTSLGFSLLVSLLPALARAECFPIEKAPLDADCVVMPYGQQRGVWFRLDKAEEFRQLKLAEPELKRQIALYESTRATLAASALDYKAAYGKQVEVTTATLEINEKLVSEARRSREAAAEAADETDAWYRSPFLWFGAGAVAALGGVILLK